MRPARDDSSSAIWNIRGSFCLIFVTDFSSANSSPKRLAMGHLSLTTFHVPKAMSSTSTFSPMRQPCQEGVPFLRVCLLAITACYGKLARNQEDVSGRWLRVGILWVSQKGLGWAFTYKYISGDAPAGRFFGLSLSFIGTCAIFRLFSPGVQGTVWGMAWEIVWEVAWAGFWPVLCPVQGCVLGRAFGAASGDGQRWAVRPGCPAAFGCVRGMARRCCRAGWCGPGPAAVSRLTAGDGPLKLDSSNNVR